MFTDADDGNHHEENGFKVNRKFAKRYEEKKKRDELFRARDRNLLLGDSDSEADEEEDEDAEALTGKLELDIMKTLSMIRNKDKRIYENEFKPFDGDYNESDESDSENSSKPNKPVRYKDLVRERALKRGENEPVSDSESEVDDEEAEESKRRDITGKPSYVESQKQLKDAFKSAAANDSDDDESDDGLVKLKVKSKEELAKEEDEFQSYMSTLKSKDKHVGSDREGVQIVESFFKDAPANADEAFLRKYILNRAWEDKDDAMGSDDNDDDDEEEFDERADAFEAKYNFRFEEEGADEVTKHPRKIDESVRQKENARKRQRLEKRKRKLEEKQRREEELRRLKNLKKQELEARLAKSVKVAGIKNKASLLKPEDLDGDFDPEEWDKKMNEIFDDDYYNESDDEFKVDKDSDADDDAPESSHKSGKKSSKVEASADDLEEEENDDQEEEEEAKTDPKILDELHKMDYEGVLDGGNIKTRFRYREVKPDAFGLSAEEILLADDKLLQSFVSLKRMAPYREHEWHAGTRHRIKFRKALQAQMEKRSGISNVKAKLKKQKLKEKKIAEFEEREAKRQEKRKAEEESSKDAEDTTEHVEKEDKDQKRKRKRKRTKNTEIDTPAIAEAEESKSKTDEEAEESSKKSKRKRKRNKKKE